MKRSKTNTVQVKLDDDDYEFLFWLINHKSMQLKGWLRIVINEWRQKFEHERFG